jgi:hypothetical protein
MKYWEPTLSLEAVSMRSLGARTWAGLRFSCTTNGSLYVFEHRTLHTERLVVEERAGKTWLEWKGAAKVIRGGRDSDVFVSTPVRFGGVTVYDFDRDRAQQLLERAMPASGLTALPPEILAPGRRRYFFFGPIEGRVGLTRFVAS